MKKQGKNRKKHIPSLTTHNSGITLVALVVTVVILLILAGITINAILGQNSIFDLARKAGDETNRAVENEQKAMENLIDYINNQGWGSGLGGARTKLADLVGKPADNTKNIDAEDKYGNPITIPAGFHVVANSGTQPADKTEEQWNAEKVVYSYNGDGTPAVQDGTVIQDASGNQFVWIPIGTITNKAGDTRGETSTITLGRYQDFAVKTDEDGNKYYQPKQTAEQYKKPENSEQTDLEYQGTYEISSYYRELTEKLSGKNEIAENLESFLENAIDNGGYYLARYEASNNGSNKPMSKANQTVWNNVTQPNSATYASSMYGATAPMKSDLVNSYAWDTAIIFIQTYSEGNSNYANQNRRKSGSSPFATGTSGDVVCNIHDMASNCVEWTTEHFTGTIGGKTYPCVRRGGNYSIGDNCTADRGVASATNAIDSISFRCVLY